MTKRERVMRAAAGESVDRVPFSFWYHFPGGERADEAFVRNQVEFAARYDVDLLKVMHDAPYDLPAGVRTYDSPEAFAELPPIDPRAGHFGRHLDALKEIKARIADDTPMLDTLFDPFAFGEKITGKRICSFLSENPEATRAGLQSIAKSLVRWAEACADVVDGIFLAAGGASAASVPADVYEQELLPLDIQVMEAAMEIGSLNALHIHGAGELHFDLLAKCPAHLYNWSDRTTDVSLRQGRDRLPTALLSGGINEATAASVSSSDIVSQVEDALSQTDGRRFLLACGCAVPSDTPATTLDALVKAVKESAQS